LNRRRPARCISRVIDFVAIPVIILGIAVIGALDIGLTSGMIAIGITMFPMLPRIVLFRLCPWRSMPLANPRASCSIRP
jgi:ABC-type dipeptide/oligopeptide/nickel transport system permease subunit